MIKLRHQDLYGQNLWTSLALHCGKGFRKFGQLPQSTLYFSVYCQQSYPPIQIL